MGMIIIFIYFYLCFYIVSEWFHKKNKNLISISANGKIFFPKKHIGWFIKLT